MNEFLIYFIPYFFNTEYKNEEEIKSLINYFCNQNNIKMKDFCMELRMSITGQKIGPSLFKIIEFLGKEECLKRIDFYCGHFYYFLNKQFLNKQCNDYKK